MMGRKRKLNLVAYSFTLLSVIGACYFWGEEGTRHLLAIAAGIGALAMLLCMVALNSLRYALRFRRPSIKPEPQPLQMSTVSSSSIRSGPPTFAYVPYTASPDMHTGEVGIWRCEGPGSFDWHFGLCDEVAYILSGEAEVEYLGRRFTLRAGDTVTFFANTETTWHVAGHIQKSYVLYLPTLAVRCYRRLFTPIFAGKLPRKTPPIGVTTN